MMFISIIQKLKKSVIYRLRDSENYAILWKLKYSFLFINLFKIKVFLTTYYIGVIEKKD